jgi:hypothetical protein
MKRRSLLKSLAVLPVLPASIALREAPGEVDEEIRFHISHIDDMALVSCVATKGERSCDASISVLRTPEHVEAAKELLEGLLLKALS